MQRETPCSRQVATLSITNNSRLSILATQPRPCMEPINKESTHLLVSGTQWEAQVAACFLRSRLIREKRIDRGRGARSIIGQSQGRLLQTSPRLTQPRRSAGLMSLGSGASGSFSPSQVAQMPANSSSSSKVREGVYLRMASSI